MKRLCSNDEAIADYLEGRLADEDRSAIESHFAQCEPCLERLMVSGSLVRGGLQSGDDFVIQPVPKRVTRTAVNIVNNLSPKRHDSIQEKIGRFARSIYGRVSNLLTPGLLGESRLAPIRGKKRFISHNLISVRKTFKKIDTEIEIERAGNNRGHIRVNLIEDVHAKSNVRVTLKNNGREISSYLLNEGHAIFEDVPFGHYMLVFITDGITIGKYKFEIKET